MSPIAVEALRATEDFRALNNAFARETSFLDEDAWQDLVTVARFAYGVAPADGFMIAMDQDSNYEGLNFQWFKARYDRFAYTDRIVIAASAHGRGLGKALYMRLFDDARAAGHVRVACEINIDPPNPGSIAFHEKLGFASVGEQLLPNGKTVRYFLKSL